MTKFVVFCGQELSIQDVLEKFPAIEFQGCVVFPEADHGTVKVTEMVRHYLLNDDPTVFLTRYGHIINELGCAISAGIISHEDVVVHLLDEGQWSEHWFTSEGFMHADWPYGVLGY